MQMMYDVIARELKAVESDAHPLDYLNFYCLGKRERFPDDKPDTNGSAVLIFTPSVSFYISSRIFKKSLIFLLYL